MAKPVTILLLVGLLAAGGGFFVAMMLGSRPSGPAPQMTRLEPVQAVTAEDVTGQRRPDFVHADSDGAMVSAEQFDGRVLLLNFWATWCQPCVEEMPMLSQLQQEFSGSGLSVVGIALDDADRARRFAAELGVTYPVLLGAADVVVTGRRYGNDTGMLPYSVLIDRSGVIRWTHLGALDRSELIRQIESLGP